MKKFRGAPFAAAILALVVFACASTPPLTVAYRTVSAVKLAVDTGMSAWADRVVAGKTTPAQQQKVREVFNEYTASARAAAAVIRSTDDPAPQTLTDAAGKLLDLLAAFGVKTGAQP